MKKQLLIAASLAIAAALALLLLAPLASRRKAEETVVVSVPQERPAPPVITSFDIRQPGFPDRTINITSYGAFGDRTTRNTDAIASAISACVDAGGGTVLVPPGKWLTGPIHLKSNVRLRVEAGAELLFDPDPALYPPVFSRHEGVEMQTPSPMVYARDCENVALAGPGVLNGQGKAWWKRGEPRPSFVQFISCRRLSVEGVTLTEGPMWTLHLAYCDGATVQNVNVQTTGPNTDGVDIDSSRNVEVSGCRFSTGDDCICIKSGAGSDGRLVNRPSENIFIHDCELTKGLCGIAVGSEIVGGVRNVRVEKCRIAGVWGGICFKAERGWGGVVEDVAFNDIQVSGVLRQAVDMSMGYEPAAGKAPGISPAFRRVRVSNLRGDVAAEPITLTGLLRYTIRDVVFEHVHLQSGRHERIRLRNVCKAEFDDVSTDSQYPPDIRKCLSVIGFAPRP